MGFRSQVTLLWAVIVAAFCIGGVFGGSVVGLVSGKFGRKVWERNNLGRSILKKL